MTHNHATISREFNPENFVRLTENGQVVIQPGTFSLGEAAEIFATGLRQLADGGWSALDESVFVPDDKTFSIVGHVSDAGSLVKIGTRVFTPAQARDIGHDALRIADQAERRNPLVQRLAEDLSSTDPSPVIDSGVTWEDIALALVKKGVRYR